jgi:hypothetical protein
MGSTATTTRNLRRDARISARVPVAVRRVGDALIHHTVDVSFRGLFLETIGLDAPPAVRSLVRLRLLLPSGAVETHGMVVHVVADRADCADRRTAGVGIQFWGLSGAERRAWESFVHVLRRKAESAPAPAHPADGEMDSGIRASGRS